MSSSQFAPTGAILHLLKTLQEENSVCRVDFLGGLRQIEKEAMAESVIIEEALAALQQRLHALAEPAAVAMKTTG